MSWIMDWIYGSYLLKAQLRIKNAKAERFPIWTQYFIFVAALTFIYVKCDYYGSQQMKPQIWDFLRP